MKKNKLRLIVMNNCKDLGSKIDKHILQMRGIANTETFIIPTTEARFSNGEGKVTINASTRGKDIYIISDVGNYNEEYDMYGKKNLMTPNNHFDNIIDIFAADQHHAKSISVIMPLLINSRQHRRKGREPLSCAIALQRLEQCNAKNIITIDAHDISVQNAIPYSSFEAPYATNEILNAFIDDIPIENLQNLMIISPDEGATARARFFASAFSNEYFKTTVGMFYKLRDFSRVVNGTNPIIAHEYIGQSVKDKTVIVVDDMIASGDSILETAEELKKRQAKNIYLITTFTLFTKGIEKFDKAYQNGSFTKIYTTNLSYIPDYIKEKEWIRIVDCSPFLARIIDNLNREKSLNPILNDKTASKKLVKKYTDYISNE